MEKLNALIEQGESETLEFKTAFGNETIETIVAFANQKGGKVLIGVAAKKNNLILIEEAELLELLELLNC